MVATHITPALFSFLKDLTRNNNREWFQENKPRYERDVKQPLLAFIAEIQPPLRTVSPFLQATPRSLFRIHRDTRFSKDKTPYKTNAGVHFRHLDGGSAHALGVYVHLACGEVFVGAGMWKPDNAALKCIRERISVDSDGWRRAISGKAFREHFRMEGAALKRAPRGYDPEHPFISDIMRKDFFAVSDFSQRSACGASFLGEVIRVAKTARPYLRFLAEANGLDW